MEKLTKIATTLRTNWKKSTFGAIVLFYGASTVKERYQVDVLMSAACKKAIEYGDTRLPIERDHRKITVILNPAANKRKAKKEFEKFCEPLLHLAGIAVDVVQTTHEGHAKDLAETLHGTEAVIIAGGDGTLSETVTGLFRRRDDGSKVPLGILPVGRTNSFGSQLFPNGEGVERAKQLIKATMAVIQEQTTQKDVMKIERISTSEENKPLYALSSIEWGAFRDALSRRDKYWFLGAFRDYATFIFNGYKDWLMWDCRGCVKYTPPCKGCLNCVEKKHEPTRTWSIFMPKMPQNNSVLSDNPLCKQVEEKCFKATEMRLSTTNVANVPYEVPSLVFAVGKNFYSYNEFISEGWQRVKSGKNDVSDLSYCRTIEIIPEELPKYEQAQIAIDNEEFDLRPFRVTLLPKAVKFYCLQ